MQDKILYLNNDLDWKNLVAKKFTNNIEIIEDIISDESLVVVFMRDDVAKILRTDADYDFIVTQNLFDDLFVNALEDTKRQLKRVLSGKSKFVNCAMNMDLFLKKIISRIANNFKNLFDERYRGSIKAYRVHQREEQLITFEDALSILMEADEEVSQKNNKRIEIEMLRIKAKAILNAGKKLSEELNKRADELEGKTKEDIRDELMSSLS